MRDLSIHNIRWLVEDMELAEILDKIYAGDRSRRAYYNGVFKGKTVFIKSFTEKGFIGFMRNFVAPRGKKEYAVGAHLCDRGILTPRPLGYGVAWRNSYIIQEHLQGERFFDRWLQEEERSRLLGLLAGLLRSLKEHSIRHNDLHAENILCGDKGLYIIDLHSVEVKNAKAFMISDEVANLSHALAMIYKTMDEGERGLFFRQYSGEATSAVRNATERAIEAMVSQWVFNKAKRAFSDTSKTHWEKERLYITGMEERVRGGLTETLKKDKKVLVERYGDHIRKTYRHKRRLKKAWKAHMVLTYMGLSVIPQTFAFKKASLFSPGYICMEDLGQKGIELDRYLDGTYDAMNIRERGLLVKGLADFFKNAFMAGIVHKDAKGCNIFVLYDGTFRFLDVEDLTFHAIDHHSLKRMLVQLNGTIPKKVLLKDRMRFFLHLTHGLGFDTKEVFRHVARQTVGSDIVYEGVDGLKRESW